MTKLLRKTNQWLEEKGPEYAAAIELAIVERLSDSIILDVMHPAIAKAHKKFTKEQVSWKDKIGTSEFDGIEAAATKRANSRLSICKECPNYQGVNSRNVDEIRCSVGKVCCGGKIDEGPLSLRWAECPELKWCKGMFQRCYVISLKRTPYRLDQFRERFKKIQWPFIEPQLFEAMDGEKLPTPSGSWSPDIADAKNKIRTLLDSLDLRVKANALEEINAIEETQNRWGQGGGAWGCMESHRQILRDCIMADVDSVLILEDDADPCPDFTTKLSAFLKNLPPNWDGMMLGGQHFGTPIRIAPGVVKTNGSVNRTHAYGVRGNLLKSLYSKWHSYFNHCDHAMGDVFDKYNVYTPDQFIIGQGRNQSQITGRPEPARFWSGYDVKARIVLIHATRQTMDVLRQDGLHRGYTCNGDGVDVGLSAIFDSGQSLTNKVRQLRQWIDLISQEASAFEHGVGAIWHPNLDETGVQAIRLALGDKFLELWIDGQENYLAERTKHALTAAPN